MRQTLVLMLDAMVQDFERATGPWQAAEWMAIPESFVLTAGSPATRQASRSGGLIVDQKKMAENLDISRGLIVAEAVMMGLAPDLGRQEAHDVVYDACRVAMIRHNACGCAAGGFRVSPCVSTAQPSNA